MFHAYLSAGASITIAKIIVAQDSLECGWGKKQAERFNMGGIICHNGQKTNSGYQAYNSIAEYVSDKKRQLQKNFPGAWESTTWKDYFDIIQNRNGKIQKAINMLKIVHMLLKLWERMVMVVLINQFVNA